MTDNPDTGREHEYYIAIWSKAIDTQMHFNDLSVKSRQLGLTFVVAALGVAIVLVTRGEDFALKVPLCGYVFQLHVSILLFLAAVVALQAVKILDLNVYHKMLRGAVAFGEDFEERFMKQIFDLERGMTQAISHASRYNDGETSQPTTAEAKIKIFYKWTTWSILLGAVLLLLVTNLANWENMNDVAETKYHETNLAVIMAYA